MYPHLCGQWANLYIYAHALVRRKAKQSQHVSLLKSEHGPMVQHHLVAEQTGSLYSYHVIFRLTLSGNKNKGI